VPRGANNRTEIVLKPSHDIFVYEDGALPCSVSDLEDSVFARIEGFGGLTGSGCGADGWNLDIEFDSPRCFIPVIEAVVAALHDCGIDAQSVTASVHGRRRKLVDLL
jgi:hypothetical protein